MWIISDKQLERISNSMREEFEKRIYCVLSKEKIINALSENEIKSNISNQLDKAIQYNFTSEEQIFQFIRLSFEYPKLQTENLGRSIHIILSSNDDQNNKIVKLVNHLKTQNNV